MKPKSSTLAQGRGLFVGQSLELLDKHDRSLGAITVSKIENGVVSGTFSPTPAYSQIKPLFDELVELVNEQLFSHLDEIDKKIEEWRLHLGSANGVPLPDIANVQAFENSITFEVKATPP